MFLEEALLLAGAEPARLTALRELLCAGVLETAELNSADCSSSAVEARLAALWVLAAKPVEAAALLPLWHPQAPRLRTRHKTATAKIRQIFAKFNKSPRFKTQLIILFYNFCAPIARLCK